MRHPSSCFPRRLHWALPLLWLLPGVAPLAAEEPSEPRGTLIESERLEIFTEEEPMRFRFEKNVSVTAETFHLTCDLLEILRDRESPEEEAPPIRLITARGQVVVRQEDRILTAEEGRIDPVAGTITLTGDPRLEDPRGKVTGDRIIIHQENGRAVVEGREDRPARVEIPRIEGFAIPRD